MPMLNPATTDVSTHSWTAFRGVPALSPAQVGLICTWGAMILYAASNSIVSLLVSIGETMPVADGRNAITYMNLLLLGSLLSIVPLVILFRHELQPAVFRQMTRRNWGYLVLSSFFSSAVTPGLFFYALAHTSVTNIVLVTRVEPPLFLLATWLILNERFSSRAMCAGLVALSGAVVMIGMREGAGLDALGKGEWATLAATLSYITSALITRRSLQEIPIGLFSVGRTILGSAIYFALVCAIVGPDAFRDIFAPVLWSWIWLYVGTVIVLAQIAWNIALKHARSETLTLANSFSPLAAILIAMALLGEVPGPGFVPGAALILFSILLSREAAAAKACLTGAFNSRISPHFYTASSRSAQSPLSRYETGNSGIRREIPEKCDRDHSVQGQGRSG
ncbi:DMT family transporter [Roseovarius sp. CAU 1744]|uniref:DMT family transporter n=1 Tax=Roseovarius sp. CAU 1744 TaxID=3140368 RepID=UPI00325BC421